jgi:integrase
MFDERKIISSRKLESRTFKEGLIHLFRRTDYKKPIWQARIKVRGAKGYIFKSTQTADEHEAYKFAEDVYNKALIKVLSGIGLKEKRFESLLLEYELALQANPLRLHDEYALRTLKIYAGVYFKGTYVSELTTQQVSAFLQWRIANGRKKSIVSANTLRCELSYLQGFLSWCTTVGHTRHLIVVNRPPATKNRRPHFDYEDWAELRECMRDFCDTDNPRVNRQRRLLCNYVKILFDSGIRVGEARTLTWRDLAEYYSDEANTSFIVLRVNGKTGSRDVVAASSLTRTGLQDTWNMRSEELGRSPDQDEYVFCSQVGRSIASFKKSFDALTVFAGVQFSRRGKKRTIYSLRHTYATLRLQEGVNVYLLARNMGTSVAMLEEFYGHTSNIAVAGELMKVGVGSQANLDKLAWLNRETTSPT